MTSSDQRPGGSPGEHSGHLRPGVARCPGEAAGSDGLRRRVLLIFVDGVGIGDDDPGRNPFLRARIPVLRELGGGTLPTRRMPRVSTGRADYLPLDATLGTPGIPQSGTGQAALLTGEDAPRLFGRHFGPWTPVGLRPLVEERSLLRRARDGGRTVVFANAYPPGWPGAGGSRRVAAPPLAARGAGVLDRHEEALRGGRAVASGIVNDGWRRRLGADRIPAVTPRTAGRTLARIAGAADLTLFAHYDTDLAGHRGGMDGCVRALERVDAMLEGVLEDLPGGCVVVLASDHGNLEDVTAQHTRNPAMGLVVGTGRQGLARRLRRLTDVTPAILEHLGIGSDAPTGAEQGPVDPEGAARAGRGEA